jgi:selenocysteine lyase/cysteine desulfurase
MKDYKPLYSHFLKARPDELHFAAHSHHFWPDITREAQLLEWDDAARLNDRKWEHIFAQIVPAVQTHIAQILNLKSPKQIALAPNTHDLLVRLFSELLTRPSLKLTTTDSEFHSFGRQLKRWEEVHAGLQVTRISTEKLLSSRASFLAELAASVAQSDVVFLSQVFFNSGLALSAKEIEQLVTSAPRTCVFIVDGYHGFAALPLDLSSLEGRIFYLGGGYKYAQGGEGVGFMVVPVGDWRPAITGWFAEFAELSAPHKNAVGFSRDGMAFWGSTLNPTGWYRFKATWDLFQSLGLTVDEIHQHVGALQRLFLAEIKMPVTLKPLFSQPLPECHGHFLTFEALSIELASQFRSQWAQKGVYIDQRGTRLRFGIGLYHGPEDIQQLAQRLS